MRKRQRKLILSLAIFIMGTIMLSVMLTNLVNGDMYQASVESTFPEAVAIQNSAKNRDSGIARKVERVFQNIWNNILTNEIGDSASPPLYKKYPSLPAGFSEEDAVHIGMIVKNVANNSRLMLDFSRCVTSILRHAKKLPLHFILLTDATSVQPLNNFLRNLARVRATVPVSVDYLDLDALSTEVADVVQLMQRHFLSAESLPKYRADLFHIAPAYHRVLPFRRLIVLDLDIRLEDDIARLHDMFLQFNHTYILAMAPELSPLYRHGFREYRHRHPGTNVGEPRPDGLSGYNAGVVLYNLDRMRTNSEYKNLLHPETLAALCTKYNFVGTLGDQDFFTLIGMEHPEWILPLDCAWNVQQDRSMDTEQYEDVFQLYHNCSSVPKLYHGNNGYIIPNTQ